MDCDCDFCVVVLIYLLFSNNDSVLDDVLVDFIGFDPKIEFIRLGHTMNQNVIGRSESRLTANCKTICDFGMVYDKYVRHNFIINPLYEISNTKIVPFFKSPPTNL